MKNNKNKVFNIIKYIFSILFVLTLLFNIKNGKIDKEKIDSIKALDQEGQNYRLVTSADDVQVPVPKGYVASQVTGENYVTPAYQHTTITNIVSSTPTVLTWSSPEGEQYPWTQDEDGIWISGNQGIPNSESVLESEEFDYIKGTTLTINYMFSSQNGDYFYIYLLNLTNNTEHRFAERMSGNTYDSFNYKTLNYAYTINDWATGRYKIRAEYRKDGSGDEGQDSAYIKTSTYFKEDENGTETINEDVKTKIHDGGFVIYQLTDEELETDPNGETVIVNDTNKDEAQATRNQYVWVPVPNIDDIMRTKIDNNGILQFGQLYKFTNIYITKETETREIFYCEPRILENHDKTKNYLQRYSNINNRENFLNKMQEDYTKMLKSINKYKGFYIGRYETGDDISHGSNVGYFLNPKIVRYNRNMNYVTWYDSYKDLERIAGKTEEYVETGMMYSSLWDFTLKWLNETETRNYKEIWSDSATWGNYNNNRLKYKLSANEEERIKYEQGEVVIPSGGVTEITYNGEIYSNSPTASNNIFDLAGNVFEWNKSRQYANSGRGVRGGDYHNRSSSSSSNFISVNPSLNTFYSTGVRCLLLIR